MGLFPIDKHHHAQLALEGDMPDQGGIELDMVSLLQGAEVLTAAQVLKGDLAVVFAPAPATLRIRSGIEKHTVGVAPQFRDGMQIERHHLIDVLLLRKK